MKAALSMAQRLGLFDFRLWHKADIETVAINVRFWG
jgi:hypothetical protein